jgi:hypothetical protein
MVKISLYTKLLVACVVAFASSTACAIALTMKKHYELSDQMTITLSLYWREQLQVCKREYLSVVLQLQVGSPALSYEVTTQKLSESQILKLSDQVRKDMSILQSQLQILLDKQRDFQRSGSYSYVSRAISLGNNFHGNEVPLSWAPQVCSCFKNETAIKNFQAQIAYKEQCLGTNRRLLEQIAAQKLPIVQPKSKAMFPERVGADTFDVSRVNRAYPNDGSDGYKAKRAKEHEERYEDNLYAEQYSQQEIHRSPLARARSFFQKPWVRYTAYLLAGVALVYGLYRFKKYLEMRRVSQSRASKDVKAWEALRGFFI